MKNRLFKPKKGAFDFSNPSLSASNTMKISDLPIITDKNRTSGGTCSPHFSAMSRLNYRKPKLNDCGGDLKKQWFVYYSYRNPETNKFQRFKIFKEINQEQTKKGRYDLANLYIKACEENLESGKSPFENFDFAAEDQENAQNIVVCIDSFLKYLKTSGLRQNTTRKYRNELEKFKIFLTQNNLAYLRINQIKKQHIFEFIEHIKTHNGVNSGKTVNHYLNDLRRFFNHYIDNYDDFLYRNPAAKITRAPVKEKGNAAFTEQQLADIKKYCMENDPYLWFPCSVVYYTGLRNEAELIFMRCGDFDLKTMLFTVDAEIAKNKTTQSAPIYPELAEILKEHGIDKLPKEWYLFGLKDQPSIKRVGINNFSKRFFKVKQALGLGNEYGIYSFKPTRACHLFDDGASIRDIQILFRHADPYVTMKYLKSLGRVERGRIYDKGRKI